MSNRSKKLLLLFGDMFLFVASMMCTVLIDKHSLAVTKYLEQHLLITMILTPIWVSVFFIEGLYSLRVFNRNGLIISLLRSVLFSSVVTVIFFYLFGGIFGITPKTNLIIFGCITFVFVFLWRKIFFKVFSYKVFTRNVVFVGNSSTFTELKDLFNKKGYLGFSIKAHVKSMNNYKPDYDTKLLVIEDNLLGSEDIGTELFNLLNTGKSILSLSEFSEVISGKVPLEAIDHTWFIDSRINLNQGSYYFSKIFIDHVIAILGICLLFPLVLILIPILYLVSGKPILYSQDRVGLNNKVFKIFKFRTMNLNAEENGAKWSPVNDDRITLIGKFLRTTRIDEIPQLWNVLNGTMSLVGPRPERPEIIEQKLINVIPFYNYRHLVKPGISGWAQVNYGYGASENDSLIKLQYDLFYVKNKSSWLDLRIILKTIKIVIGKIGR